MSLFCLQVFISGSMIVLSMPPRFRSQSKMTDRPGLNSIRRIGFGGGWIGVGVSTSTKISRNPGEDLNGSTSQFEAMPCFRQLTLLQDENCPFSHQGPRITAYMRLCNSTQTYSVMPCHHWSLRLEDCGHD